MEQRQLRMIRPDLDDLPPVVLPDGCEIRAYRPGDEKVWAEIMNTGIGSDWDAARAKEHLTRQPRFDPEGLFFAALDGKTVGSACAWRSSAEERKTGMVHMLCVLPEARGRKIGYALTLRALHYFRDHGFSDAYLDTDDVRIPAIKAYLRLGFEPFYYDETHMERWERVRSEINAG